MGPRVLEQESIELDIGDSIDYSPGYKKSVNMTQFEIDQTTQEGTLLDQSQISD